jgi:DNA mismatch repair protein MutS
MPESNTQSPPATAAKTAEAATLSPAMRQYQQFKAQHPGYILFFRMGDFYEMFWEDAQTAAKVLGVALTSRSKGEDAIPMAGVPFHAVDGYLRKMIAAGFKVAICEQMEEASAAKGLVKREIVRLMTPGTLTDDSLLEGRSDNYLAAVAFNLTKNDGYKAALAWVELSTGSCTATSGTEDQILDEISRLRPAEVLVQEMPSGQPHAIGKLVGERGIKTVTTRPGWQFTAHHAREQVQKQWQATTVAGFGFAEDDPAVFAVAAILSYLGETQRTSLTHLRPLRRHVVENHLSIDPASWRSLEIERTVRADSAEGSLLWAIDRTRTSMGGRLLRQWLRAPLCEASHVEARQAAVAALLESPADLTAIVELLDDCCDIERIVGRLSVSRAGPRDLVALGRCLSDVPRLLDRLAALPHNSDVAPDLVAMKEFCAQRGQYLTGAIKADAAPHLREGDVIAAGFDAELDRLRQLSSNSQRWLAQYQAKLSQETSISSLKVSFNRVFGYYIEVTDAHRAKVPTAWTRRQTVRNAERYITAELKKFEEEATGARDRAVALEQELFEKVRLELLPHVPAMQELAAGIARVDVLAGLATLARERRYCRPTITQDRLLQIEGGKHPVLEQQLASQFVANDVKFDADDSLFLITGPNMAGKSTYIRQTALIVLMAQIGSYVPAASATIGLADRLFARIGASDEIHGGQSTFMVEMIETANILNNATDRSLVVLDEIGRGTSTLDGLSLAWAISEQIATDVRCRTLFATHYHELTELAQRLPGVKNLNVAVREWEDQVIFLHKIVEGGTDRSYGIHVARLAGVPVEVLTRARQLLGELAVQHVAKPRISRRRGGRDDGQLELFVNPADEVIRTLAGLDVKEMSAEQALAAIKDMKAKLSS